MHHETHENNRLKSDRTPLLEYLKRLTQKSESASEADLANLLALYERLLANQDEITLLIMEITALNIITHGQTVHIESYEDQLKNKDKHSSIYLGQFDQLRKSITIAKYPYLNDFLHVVIHEFTHAVSGFTFAFDPRTDVASNDLGLYSKDTAKQLFFNAMDDFYNPPLPYPTKKNPLLHEKSTKIKYRYPESMKINPAALKFQQCVREDLRNATQAKTIPDIMGKYIDLYFSRLKREFPNDDFSAERNLAEVLPIYMELRTRIVALAKQQGHGINYALNLLAKHTPRIHDYCETDFKKVLSARLRFFANRLYVGNAESIYLNQHPHDYNAKVETTYSETGRLRLVKA